MQQQVELDARCYQQQARLIQLMHALCDKAIVQARETQKTLQDTNIRLRNEALDSLKNTLGKIERALKMNSHSPCMKQFELIELCQQKVIYSRIYLDPNPLDEAIALITELRQNREGSQSLRHEEASRAG